MLPAAFPNLLANGASAFGRHGDQHSAAQYCRIMRCGFASPEGPKARVDTLLEHVQGPDFPTGGVWLSPRLYTRGLCDGRGSLRVRARYEVEENRAVLANYHHRNSLSGAEVAADRENRRADAKPRAAHAG